MNFGSSGQNDDDSQKEDKSRQRHAMERDNIILESDLRRLNAKRNEMEAEIRDLQKQKQRLEMNIQEKESELKRILSQVNDIQNQEDRLKKKMNTLV